MIECSKCHKMFERWKDYNDSLIDNVLYNFIEPDSRCEHLPKSSSGNLKV
jgi:uncharacterized C2H2 Zn-finger protein